MTAEPQQGNWTLGLLLDLFDVEPDGPDRFIGKSGHSAGECCTTHGLVITRAPAGMTKPPRTSAAP